MTNSMPMKPRKSKKIEDDKYILDGKVLLSEVNDLFGSDLENDGVDTIGGWLFAANPDIEVGTSWTYDGLTFVVLKKDSHRIRRIEVSKQRTVADDVSLEKSHA